jgi:hypothetical protein
MDAQLIGGPFSNASGGSQPGSDECKASTQILDLVAQRTNNTASLSEMSSKETQTTAG